MLRVAINGIEVDGEFCALKYCKAHIWPNHALTMPRCQNIECGQDREEARKPEVGMISTFIDARWQGRRTSAMAIHSSVVQYYQYLSNIRQAISRQAAQSTPPTTPSPVLG